MLNFGFGDAAVSGHSFGSTSTDPDAYVTVMTPDALHPYHNTLVAADVNGDGAVTPLDALIVIDALNSEGTGTQLIVPPPSGDTPPPFIDVNGDNILSAADALTVIDALNSAASQSAVLSQAGVPDFADVSSEYATARAVPEPSAFVLAAPLATGAFLWLLVRRKGRRAAV
jgi:hypothetical protein